MMQTIVINITGKVQGVFFRQSTREKAIELKLTGTVCNLDDSSVQVVATGLWVQLDNLIAWCRQGPPRATVKTVEWREEIFQSFDDFKILR